MSQRKRFKKSAPEHIRLNRDSPGRWSWWFRGYRGQDACAWYVQAIDGRYRIDSRDLANGFAHRDTLPEVRKLIAEQYEHI